MVASHFHEQQVWPRVWNSYLLKAAELLDESNYTKEHIDAYDRHLLAVYDINRSRIESYDEGYDDGMKKDRHEGVQVTISILKDIQKKKLSYETISQKYEISLDEVARLAKELE